MEGRWALLKRLADAAQHREKDMNAWFARRYGGPEVLRREELPVPAPGAGEVLVRVRATTVSTGDVRVRGLDLPPGMELMGRLALGWNGPRQPIMGTEFSGIVEAVGEGVSRFHKGEAVYAFPGGKMGAHAQYARIAETGPIALIPEGLDFRQAAALCFGGTTALHFLRQAKIKPDEAVLVIGAAGAVGLALAQLARHRGAKVTALTSTGNLDLLRAYGIERVIDRTTTDVTALNERFDIVADTAAAMDFARAQNLLRPNGRYLAIAGALREMLGSLRKGPEGRRMIAGPAPERLEDLIELGRLAASGACLPHIDRVFGWDDMQAAHAYVETRRKRGSALVETGL